MRPLTSAKAFYIDSYTAGVSHAVCCVSSFVCLLSPTGQLGVGHQVVAAAAPAHILPGCAGLRALSGEAAVGRGAELQPCNPKHVCSHICMSVCWHLLCAAVTLLGCVPGPINL